MKIVNKAIRILWFYFNWFAIILTIFVLFGFGCNKGKLQLTPTDLIFPSIATIIFASSQLYKWLNKDRIETEKAHHLDGEPEPF